MKTKEEILAKHNPLKDANGYPEYFTKDVLDAMESYASQQVSIEREKAEAEKRELAKEMNRQFSIEFEKKEAEKKALIEKILKKAKSIRMTDVYFYSKELIAYLNNLNEPKLE